MCDAAQGGPGKGSCAFWWVLLPTLTADVLIHLQEVLIEAVPVSHSDTLSRCF